MVLIKSNQKISNQRIQENPIFMNESNISFYHFNN